MEAAEAASCCVGCRVRVITLHAFPAEAQEVRKMRFHLIQHKQVIGINLVRDSAMQMLEGVGA